MSDRISHLDVAVGGALAALGITEGLRGWTGEPEQWWSVATVMVVMAALVVRRAWPAVSVGVLVAVLAAQAAWGSSLPGGYAESLATVVVVYSLGAQLALRASVVLAAVVAAGQGAAIALSGDSRLGNFVYAGTVTAVAWLAGRGRRLALERSDLLSERRVAQERARIARELHDVVAHHVSAIVVQSSAERRGLPDDDPVGQVLADVERRGRETLTELRRLLGVLRLDDEAAAPLTPQPRLTDLPHLVRQMADAGLDVTWEVSGEPSAVDEGVELAVYRVVQESLTNVAKHAADRRAAVNLSWRPGQVEVEVVSRGESARRVVPGSGFGLRAMADRVEAHGGDFSARRTNEGFRVHALLPVEGR